MTRATEAGGGNGGGTLAAFFLLTFALTWAAWAVAAAIPARATSGVTALHVLRVLAFHLGVFAPAIVALALTARHEGRAGVRALLGRIGRWEVGVRWYLFAAGYMLAIKLAAALVHRVATGGWPRFGDTPWPLMLLAAVAFTWVQAGEEVGWRGYALPRLTTRLGLAGASLLLGAVWAAWHLPLFYAPEGDTYGQSFPLYLLQVTALSVAMAWLYWRTGGSLLLVMLLHAAVNNTAGVVPSAATTAANPLSFRGSPVSLLTAGLLWAVAAYLLYRMRGVRRTA
jgi:uncharacterized protein